MDLFKEFLFDVTIAAALALFIAKISNNFSDEDKQELTKPRETVDTSESVK